MRRLIAVLVFSLLLVASARGVLVIGGPGLPNIPGGGGGGACTLWNPSNASVIPVEIFDPSTFTYSGSNFTSGTNTGSATGNWVLNSGTASKGPQLNGLDVISFTGSQEIVNTPLPWSSGNVYIFTVAKVSTTQSNSLISASWAVGEGRDATHGWAFYPRIGSALGGSANEAFLFQGTNAAVITRGDLFTDANYHIAAIKMGTSVDLRQDGTAGSPSSITGTINAPSSAKIRVGSSGPSGAEALTGSIAYLAVLVDPTTADIQNFEGWAAWRFGLQANLPGGHPGKSAAPCAGGPAPGCTVSPCDPAPLTWTQIQSDNGILATRQPIVPAGQPDAGYGTAHDNGLYPYGIAGFDWELGGFSYLGDPTRVNDTECPTNRGFYCNSMTAWHIVYPRAISFHGAAAPNNPATLVYYRNYQSWCHFTSGGGWFLAQDAATISGGISTGLFTATQSSAVNQPVTNLGGGVFRMATPTPGFANHGWPVSQGGYAYHTVDQCYSQYEVRVDQPNANLLAAGGMDWWAPGGNTGYSQTIWVLLTQDWQRITGTSMSLAALKADPPPPLVGIGP